MCAPVATLALVGAGLSAVGAGFGALQANAQANYQARVAERNAALEREAGQQEILNTREEALQVYRRKNHIQGQLRVAAAAGGVAADYGTVADIAADNDMLADEDLSRTYRQGNERLRGRDIAASNYMGEASAQRQAGKGALIKGAFDFGSSVLGGVSQYKQLKANYGTPKVGTGGEIMVTRGKGFF